MKNQVRRQQEGHKERFMEDYILGIEKVWKLFIKFSIPAIVSMTVTGLQTIIDGIFLGNFVGANAMASINMAAPFVSLIFGFIMIITIGGMSSIGRDLGAGNVERAQSSFNTCQVFLVVSGILMGLIGFFGSEQIARALGANDVLIQGVAQYIRTLAIFVPILSFAVFLGMFTRLIGKPNLFLKSSIVSIMVNVVLNYVFIKKMQLGTLGAGLATGLCFTTSCVIVGYPFVQKKSPLKLFRGKADFKTLGPMLYNGSSEGISSVAAATAAFVFNTAFMKVAGEVGVSAFTAVNYVAQLGMMTIFGISSGIGAIISYNYGAKNHDRVKAIMKLAILTSTAIGIGLFLILSIFNRQLIALFLSQNEEVLVMASNGAKLLPLPSYLMALILFTQATLPL